MGDETLYHHLEGSIRSSVSKLQAVVDPNYFLYDRTIDPDGHFKGIRYNDTNSTEEKIEKIVNIFLTKRKCWKFIVCLEKYNYRLQAEEILNEGNIPLDHETLLEKRAQYGIQLGGEYADTAAWGHPQKNEQKRTHLPRRSFNGLYHF